MLKIYRVRYFELNFQSWLMTCTSLLDAYGYVISQTYDNNGCRSLRTTSILADYFTNMHYKHKICILYGFPCEMDFSHHESPNPTQVACDRRVGFGDKWWEIHLTWKTIQNAFSRILYTSRHVNHAKYTPQSWRSWKPCEMDLSHNCSLHGGKSEVCENISAHQRVYTGIYALCAHIEYLHICVCSRNCQLSVMGSAILNNLDRRSIWWSIDLISWR